MPKKETRPSDQNVYSAIGRECICYNLRKASRMVTQRFDDMLRPTGLRSTQFGLLVAARGFGPVTVSNLARGMMMDRTTLARNLGVLEKRGMLEIEPGDDQRTRYVSITQKGRRLLDEAFPYWQKAQDHFVNGMGEERVAHLLKDLAAVLKETAKS